MSPSPQEQAQTERFASSYERHQSPVMHRVERRVWGCDYGGTSWTTRDEADRIAGLLELRPGLRILDLGSGSGWPALYWAAATGCDAVLTDLPLTGLRIAAARAASDRPPGNCWFSVADGTALPFADDSFEAISHSDVLCCLSDKAGALQSCARVLGPNGRMVFSVIYIAPNLSGAAYDRAEDAGPPCVEAEADYPTLLNRTGWRIAGQIDVTENFAETIRRLIREEEHESEAMAVLFGEMALAERWAGHRLKLAALEDGLLRREIFNVDRG
ncbi:MAG: methyltransferase domain-containing protein [Rhodospirillaceae bacterium]|jgi:ubiquinone/menaquinone biosynthesis C-methylase UbiE|nr:methyltransferase domain-containing protein [Rhodospirillaceae bacterium]MBT5897421.1 methyltransferase domain-containing protein [Rhodospirillaceae bacterium]MBT6428344.1 methyltransferase domain-containing protein [Rhodospirillaceae bacterium]MBT7756690.1 methyltransferase domain-containing protein [Rhodospirillaceae bacterium]